MNKPNTTRFVGLDVHRDSIAIAVAMLDGRPAESLGTVPNDIPGLIKRLLRLGPAESLRCCYEAGPTGFGLVRRLKEAGIACEVIAPSLVPVQPGARVKTDRRDAKKLAQYLRSGDLTPIHVLDPGHRGDPRPRAGPRRRQACRTGGTAPTLEVPAAAWPLVRGPLDLGAGSPGLAGQATVRQ